MSADDLMINLQTNQSYHGCRVNVSAHIVYSGRVQGVGFRMTVRRFALNLALTGWVKNLPNGKVEILAEGPKEKIMSLCQEIDAYFDNYVQSKDIHYATSSNQFKDFKIAY